MILSFLQNDPNGLMQEIKTMLESKFHMTYKSDLSYGLGVQSPAIDI